MISLADLIMSQSIPSRPFLELVGHKGRVNSAVFNFDGEYCLTAGSDKDIKLWNAQSGNCIKTYSGHGYEVLAISVYDYRTLLGYIYE